MGIWILCSHRGVTGLEFCLLWIERRSAEMGAGRSSPGMLRRESLPCFAGTRIPRKAWKSSIPFPCPVMEHPPSSNPARRRRLQAQTPAGSKALECVLTSHIHWLCTFIRRSLALGQVQPPLGCLSFWLCLLQIGLSLQRRWFGLGGT